VKTILEAANRLILWSGRWEYELRSGEDMIGVLRIQGDWGTRALAETSEGKWLFRRVWWPSAKVLMRPADSSFDTGVLRQRWLEKRSILEFPYGRVFYWVPMNRWETECVFTDGYDNPLLHFKRHSNPVITLFSPSGTSAGRLTIEVPAFGFPELPLLALLGCYLMVIESM
jgi:hypothetical protein